MKRKLIKLTILSLALLMLLSACSSTPQPSETEMPSQDEELSTIQTEAPPVLGGNLHDDEDRVVVMDSVMYRGIVEGLQAQDGGYSLRLHQADGTSFGYPSLTAVIDASTRANFDLGTLQDGMYIEVYFSDSMNGNPVTIIAANKLPDADLSVYNGTVVNVEELDAETKRVELQDLNGESTTIFHVGPETQVYMDETQITEGAKLNIYHSGALTRSIPPQGNALEIRPYSAA